MTSEDDFTWEYDSLKIFNNKKCEHDVIVEQKMTDFGKRFLRRLAGTEFVIIGVGVLTGHGGPALGAALAAVPAVYLLSSESFISSLSEDGDAE
jgi:hypothetical protein